MPKIYAHRGGAGYFAENTLKAFEFAIEQGCAGAELDVHLTKDGEVVVHHNDKLNHKFAKNADGRFIAPDEELALNELMLEQIKSYTVGEPNPTTHNKKAWTNLLPEQGQTIPTLKELISLVKEKSDSFELIIDIKTDIFKSQERPWQKLVESVVQIVHELEFTHRTKFCSFDWNALFYAKTLSPNIYTLATLHPLSWLGDSEVPKTDIPPKKETLDTLREALVNNTASWYGTARPKTLQEYTKIAQEQKCDGVFVYHTDCSIEFQNALYEKNMLLFT